MRTVTNQLCIRLIAASLAILASFQIAQAELNPTSELEGCKLHVVGIYMPKNRGVDDRVLVQVEKTQDPIVLVMTGYFGTRWNLQVADGAKLKKVIIAGYYEHFVEGVPVGVPVETYTHFPVAQGEDKPHFWAFSWNSIEGQTMRERLRELTGLPIATFQGEYLGTKFVVDGVRGDSKKINEQIATLNLIKRDDVIYKVAKIQSAQVNELMSKMKVELALAQAKLRENEATIKSQQLKLMHRQEAIEQGGKEIKAGEVIDPEVDVAFEVIDLDGPTGVPTPMLVEKLVRQAFDLELQLQAKRVRQAELNLQRVKAQLARRKANASSIIQSRIEQLLKESSDGVVEFRQSVKVDADEQEDAAVLAAEGWKAWNNQDPRLAIVKFEKAIDANSSLEQARNGLGWARIQVQQYDKAIEQFESLLKDQPTHAGALNGIGQALFAQRKFDEAEKQFLKATETLIEQYGEERAISRQVTAAWFGLVRTYLEKQKYSDATKWAERYLKVKPDDAQMNELLEQAKQAASNAKKD
ncbi:tetratricopeptide repeat protein [Stieleria sp. JC731]|uniref:tetratricopeptide repeat protein n=1 Tax=Pirellulaceae TaxID=2691357 RepID=UPI001E552036|nr:tetratricopeptide repeat protein [Stieleria sp. JC731]MCC9599554.1 tetratricopeptide repeat protein [Stieleria sp. JC731]